MSDKLTLDDTLHAVMRTTHVHGLPLKGLGAHAGYVQVFCPLADLQWWTPWLTTAPAVDTAVRAWRKEDGAVCVHVSGVRCRIDWSLAYAFPADVADPVLDSHGVTVTASHDSISPAVVVALAKAIGEGAADEQP